MSTSNGVCKVIKVGVSLKYDVTDGPANTDGTAIVGDRRGSRVPFVMGSRWLKV